MIYCSEEVRSASPQRWCIRFPLLTAEKTSLLRNFVSILLIFLTASVFGQSALIDSLWDLPEVLVQDSLLLAGMPASVHLDADKLAPYQQQSVAQVLANEGLAFVKSYGLGSLATPSVRGGAAGQTAVFWNDLPIQSPMLGLLDLALIPVSGLSELSLQYGGESAEQGSGAVSGSIHLKTAEIAEGLDVNLHSSVGSFGQWSEKLRAAYRHKRWGIALSGQWDEAKNDFPFQLREDFPVQRLPHAEFSQQASQQQLFWQPNTQHRFELTTWQQRTERNLPPTTVQTRSLASQSDRIWRHMLHWRGTGQRALWNGRAAYFKEELIYRDEINALIAPSGFDTYLLRLDRSTSQHKNWLFKTGLHYQYASAIADGYAKREAQQQIAVFEQIRWQARPNLSARLTLRLEQVIGQQLIPAFDLQLERNLRPQQQVYFNWSRDFRVPTLNDRFWAQGGNPNLLTEYAWNYSLGLKGRKAWRSLQFNYELALFNRQVDDWIQWSQREGDSFFSARNVAEVWSRGVEPSFGLRQQMGSGEWQLQMRYHWTKSTYETNIGSPLIQKGNQLWYTPEHQWNGSLGYQRKHWQVHYQHQWISETNGINDDLAAYAIGNLRGQFNWQKQWGAALYLQLNNIWDTSYRVIERRPMPGRNVQLGLQIQFKNNRQS